MTSSLPTPALLLLASLCVWRVTHLLSLEDGPWDVIARVRRVLKRSMPGALLDCFYCLSLWIAVPFAAALAEGWGGRLLLWLASSAGAILLERLSIRSPVDVVPVPFYEQEESDHARMLRKEEPPADRT